MVRQRIADLISGRAGQDRPRIPKKRGSVSALTGYSATMNFLLLTHQRELARKTNTGGLVAEVMGNRCRRLLWERVTPDDELLRIVERHDTALVYPSPDSVSISRYHTFNSFIIIDSTWQEAGKIYNRSPYLRQVRTVRLECATQSIYTLRRNQIEKGLCTAECVVAILRTDPRFERQANEIEDRLTRLVSSRNQHG